MYQVLTSIIIIYGVFVLFCSCETEVALKQGKVRGHFGYSHKGRTFLAFEGIPYAKPPIGNLRFEPPEPANQWEGILEANKVYTCAQLLPLPYIWGPSGTEDCLYIYVYLPSERVIKDANLPVVVHIHAGAFMLGSPRMMALPDLIMDKDVIYVTMNYRLGILGFLSTGDDVVPGNMGLKDQSMALKWIKENIKEFGGNPDSITLTGFSAGGASVHYHYLSSMSQGLFHRGYSISGTALQAWALTKNPLEKAKFVARNVSCETDTTDKMISCLRSKSYKDLIVGIAGLFVLISIIPATPFGPVVEHGGKNPFITEHPYKLLKEGKVYDVPWITSNVLDEGLFPTGFYFHYNKLEYISDNWDTIMPSALDMSDTVDDALKKDVVNKIKEFYYKDKPVNIKNSEIFIKLHTDRYFIIDSELAVRTHAQAVKSPVYYYFFKFLPENHFPFKNLKGGVAHGLDAKLMFQWILLSDLKENEEKMMFVMTEFVNNYAVTGIPQIAGVKWDPVDSKSVEIRYLEVNSPTDVQMKSVKELAPKEFWKSLPIKENNHLY